VGFIAISDMLDALSADGGRRPRTRPAADVEDPLMKFYNSPIPIPKDSAPCSAHAGLRRKVAT
jgi:hypothetical protein